MARGSRIGTYRRDGGISGGSGTVTTLRLRNNGKYSGMAGNGRVPWVKALDQDYTLRGLGIERAEIEVPALSMPGLLVQNAVFERIDKADF